jgi:hypothetical protein
VAGHNVGPLLRGVDREQVVRGQEQRAIVLLMTSASDLMEELFGKELMQEALDFQEADRQTKCARVGGTEHGEYEWAYLAAARLVLDSASDEKRLRFLAMPVAYLQRHTLEVLLKETIHHANWIIWAKQRLARAPHATEWPAPVPMKHALSALARHANKRLHEIGLQLPDGVDGLCAEMEVIEDGDETRLRYPRGKTGRDSFPMSERIPLGSWQTRLESLKGEFDWDWDGPETFGNTLFDRREELFDALNAAGLMKWETLGSLGGLF